MQLCKMSKSNSAETGSTTSVGGEVEPLAIPVHHRDQTFAGCHEVHIEEMERRIDDEKRRKKRHWEREVEHMRDEFLSLYPSDRKWGSEEMLSDPMVIKRRGSTDVLDIKNMHTVYPESPSPRRTFRLRFNCVGFNQKSVRVNTDGKRIIVTGTKYEQNDSGETVEREYIRKIEKPKRVDTTRLKSALACDGILLVEATISHSHHSLIKSPSHSSGSHPSPVSSSNFSDTTPSPCHNQKMLEPLFFDADNGLRYMTLVLDIGEYFDAEDITVLIVKDNRLQIKAKHEEKTSERCCKYKFSRTFELPEKIESFTTRGGFSADGRVVAGTMVKGSQLPNMSLDDLADWLKEEIGITSKKYRPVNVLDIARFPPTHVRSYLMMPAIMRIEGGGPPTEAPPPPSPTPTPTPPPSS